MKTLSANGANIPALGFGTWQLRDETCSRLVNAALAHGYRHIDTAAMYDNEEAVGAGIAASGIARKNIFLTTKVWPTEVSEGSFQKSVEASLKKLGTDYVDLILIHWPPKDADVQGWARLLNDVAKRGWANNIGVSNFTTTQLASIVEASERPIVVNQIENHPYLNQSKLRAACAALGTALIAYCPLYRGGPLFEEPAVLAAAKAHSKSPAQVVLRWHVQHEGAGAIPKTQTPARMEENFDIFDFELSQAEVAAISALTSKNSRICDFEFSPEWDEA